MIIAIALLAIFIVNAWPNMLLPTAIAVATFVCFRHIGGRIVIAIGLASEKATQPARGGSALWRIFMRFWRCLNGQSVGIKAEGAFFVLTFFAMLVPTSVSSKNSLFVQILLFVFNAAACLIALFQLKENAPVDEDDDRIISLIGLSLFLPFTIFTGMHLYTAIFVDKAPLVQTLKDTIISFWCVVAPILLVFNPRFFAEKIVDLKKKLLEGDEQS